MDKTVEEMREEMKRRREKLIEEFKREAEKRDIDPDETLQHRRNVLELVRISSSTVDTIKITGREFPYAKNDRAITYHRRKDGTFNWDLIMERVEKRMQKDKRIQERKDRVDELEEQSRKLAKEYGLMKDGYGDSKIPLSTVGLRGENLTITLRLNPEEDEYILADILPKLREHGLLTRTMGETNK